MAVQVSLAVLEIVTAIAGRNMIGAAIVYNFIRCRAAYRREVEVGYERDTTGCITGLLVEQEDVVATCAGVQVLVDDRPPLIGVSGLQGVRLTF